MILQVYYYHGIRTGDLLGPNSIMVLYMDPLGLSLPGPYKTFLVQVLKQVGYLGSKSTAWCWDLGLGFRAYGLGLVFGVGLGCKV